MSDGTNDKILKCDSYNLDGCVRRFMWFALVLIYLFIYYLFSFAHLSLSFLSTALYEH